VKGAFSPAHWQLSALPAVGAAVGRAKWHFARLRLISQPPDAWLLGREGLPEFRGRTARARARAHRHPTGEGKREGAGGVFAERRGNLETPSVRGDACLGPHRLNRSGDRNRLTPPYPQAHIEFTTSANASEASGAMCSTESRSSLTKNPKKKEGTCK
jgi:hypothetical protein